MVKPFVLSFVLPSVFFRPFVRQPFHSQTVDLAKPRLLLPSFICFCFLWNHLPAIVDRTRWITTESEVKRLNQSFADCNRTLPMQSDDYRSKPMPGDQTRRLSIGSENERLNTVIIDLMRKTLQCVNHFYGFPYQKPQQQHNFKSKSLTVIVL